jgi:hypothetical protein
MTVRSLSGVFTTLAISILVTLLLGTALVWPKKSRSFSTPPPSLLHPSGAGVTLPDEPAGP